MHRSKTTFFHCSQVGGKYGCGKRERENKRGREIGYVCTHMSEMEEEQLELDKVKKKVKLRNNFESSFTF